MFSYYKDDAAAEHDLYIAIVWVFPAVCFISIVGNMINLRVVVIHGLNKSYNVMLVCLAVADSTCMLSFVLTGGFALAACHHLHDNTSAYFHLYRILQILDYGGAWTSFMMPLFLTSERILAVWFPLRYNKLLSARKTSVAMVALYITLFTLAIYMTVYYYDTNYLHICDSKRKARGLNFTHTCLINIAVFRNSIDRTSLNKHISGAIFGPVIVSLVLCGCFFISVKIIMDAVKRARMSARRRKKTTELRITLTLLAVCLLYGGCSLSIYLINVGTQEDVNCETDKIVLTEVLNMMALINCSANPVIYVLLNPRFRRTIVKMYYHDILRGEWLPSRLSFASTSFHSAKSQSLAPSDGVSMVSARNRSVALSEQESIATSTESSLPGSRQTTTDT